MGEPDADCALCPRLVRFRQQNRSLYPDWHNGPVPSFGGEDACLLIVGLAPGLRGANRTGRPFTGDFAGGLLYGTLDRFGFSEGSFDARPDDGLRLVDCRIANAVRCLPPENKPIGAEVNACRPFLEDEINRLKRLRVVLALGVVAHGAAVRALGRKKKDFPFRHGALYRVSDQQGRPLVLADSYHCSRYNTNTGRLTPAMFEAVFTDIRSTLVQPWPEKLSKRKGKLSN